MLYFAISSKFNSFEGVVVEEKTTLKGVYLPHQVIKNCKGNILLAQKITPKTWEGQIGQKLIVEAARNNDYSRLLINPDLDEPVEGVVRAVKTFSLGRNAFFTDLDIYQGDENFVHIAFRPLPSQKRKMGMELCGKKISVTAENLFILNGKGKKLWPK